jgi:tetratricopeptide (TPR) repeat protein
VATQKRLTLALVVGVPLVALLALAWYAGRGSHSRFLMPAAGAQWIRYPVPPQIAVVGDRYPQRAVFRRTFQLAARPPHAHLQARAFSDCSISLNGQSLALSPAESGNTVRATNATEQLRPGTNEIVAIVANDTGPPLFWLYLEWADGSLKSDHAWSASLDGTTECAAQPSEEPSPIRRGNPADGGTTTLASLKARWPLLVLLAVLGAGLTLIARVAPRQPRIASAFNSPLLLALLLAAVLWGVLLVHNALAPPQLPCGFNFHYHLQYIQYILDNRTLPLADQGWEMHQPPLFYLLAASVLGICGLSTADAGAVVAVRLMGLAIGLAQLALVARCLRLLFPGQPRRQIAGLALAAFLPVHLYTCQYITNESLLMVLGTAAIYLCLVILQNERYSPVQHGFLGLCLGAAFLTKITAIVIAGIVLVVLAGRLVVRRRTLSDWLRTVGLATFVMLLVSSWHYARVWARFGTPLVGNYDSISGFRFWQHPGYGTGAYLFRFGRALTHPFFSAFDSLPDGLYSTWWGDGLCGGMGSWNYRPPWNYDLMAVGYLLALVPSLVIAIGLIAALVQLVRRPQAEWFLVLGVAGGLVAALLFQFIRYPYYGHARASYLLTGMMPMCAFGALGMGILGDRARLVKAVILVFVGLWACIAYACYWIDPEAAATHTWAGLQQLSLKHPAEAEAGLRKAIAKDPQEGLARFTLAGMLLQRHQVNEARRLVEGILHDNPDDPDALFGLAACSQAEGRLHDAVAPLRRASEIAADNPMLYSMLGGLLFTLHWEGEAMTAYREALRISPSSPSDHANLGLLLARKGQIEEAVAQYRRALGLRPDQAAWLADLAWILATQQERRLRQPEEALRLAQEACQRTQNRDAIALQSLAAAFAACGRYEEAMQVAQQALRMAETRKQTDLADRIREQVGSYENRSLAHASGPIRATPYTTIGPRRVDEW